jgi:hypothetical protein
LPKAKVTDAEEKAGAKILRVLVDGFLQERQRLAKLAARYERAGDQITVACAAAGRIRGFGKKTTGFGLLPELLGQLGALDPERLGRLTSRIAPFRDFI